MTLALDAVIRLTERLLPAQARHRALQDFARATGWRPSDALVDYPGSENLASGHLVVEHGLSSTAVLTFLKENATFADLPTADRLRLLSISYNNLTDWHLFPDRHGLTAVYNRRDPALPEFFRRDKGDDLWRVESFDRITGRRPNPNIKALDDALIETVSLWKRSIAAELGRDIPNRHFSALFNAILLVRAMEDHRNSKHGVTGLDELLDLSTDAQIDIGTQLKTVLRHWQSADSELVREMLVELDVFRDLAPQTRQELFGDFYSNRFAPYRYDFSLISKQALSRIYEKYVAVLRSEDSPQLTLFRELPVESREMIVGEVYTPQYITRFFARYLKEHLTPRDFRSIRTLDPACGSGMFLRTLLELQCDPIETPDLEATVDRAFEESYGVDVDPNACFATKLSLSLLYLVLRDNLPKRIHVQNAEAIKHFQGRPEDKECFDVVIANPPFVKWDDIEPPLRERIVALLGAEYSGRPDLFTAFLKLGLDLVKPGGHLLYVLPHSFLLSDSNRNIREQLAEKTQIEVLVDLTEIPVFEGLGTYVVLLICRKRKKGDVSERSTLYAKVRDSVGNALQRVLQQREETTRAYSIYSVPQESFREGPWVILPKVQQTLKRRLRRLERLDSLCELQQGLVTGLDKAFIRPRTEVPKGEAQIWKPFIRDREIPRYRIPSTTSYVVFYPHIKGNWLDEEALAEEYPNTYEWLGEQRQALSERAPVRRKNCEWWEIAWPRNPKDVYGRPKLISPHLTITPRFAYDLKGRVAVSRAPMILAKDRADELSLLAYVAAVLNSTVGFWQIMTNSHKYRSGYAMLEKKTLADLYLPHPASLETSTMREIIDLVTKRADGNTDEDVDEHLDLLVANAYQLSAAEREEIGAGHADHSG